MFIIAKDNIGFNGVQVVKLREVEENNRRKTIQNKTKPWYISAFSSRDFRIPMGKSCNLTYDWNEIKSEIATEILADSDGQHLGDFCHMETMSIFFHACFLHNNGVGLLTNVYTFHWTM